MDFTSKQTDQGMALNSAAACEVVEDLECPNLALWGSDEHFTLPDPPEFADWNSDLPLPEPEGGASFLPCDLPPPQDEATSLLDDEGVESPSLFPWIGDGWKQEEQTPDGADEAGAADSMPAPEMDSPTEAPVEFVAPEAATCERNDRDRLRRDQMKEYANRLWPDVSQAPAAAPMRNPYLICTLDDESFALPLASVVEIQRLPAVTPVPHTPEWLVGAANHRGDVLSVVDLAGFLERKSASTSPGRRLIVVKATRDGLTVGLVVDHVRGIRDLASEAIAPSASLHGTATVAQARGKCDDAGRPCTILDLDELLLSTRMRRLDLD